MPNNPVPMSGRSTAVGFCIENIWGTVPTSGVSEPKAIGGPNNPHRFFITDPSKGFPMKPMMDVAENENDGDFGIHRVTMEAHEFPGEITFKVDAENLYYLLLGILGRDIQTVVQAADSTHSEAVRHDMRPNSTKGYQPSFTTEFVFGDHNHGMLTSGVVIEKVTITFGKIVMVTVTMCGAHQIPGNYPDNSGNRIDYDFGSGATILPAMLGGDGTIQVQRTAAPVYVDVVETTDGNGPLVFAGMTFGSQAGFAATYMTIDGVSVPLDFLEGATITIERNIQKFMTAGSDFDIGAVVGNAWKVSGKIDLLYTDNYIPLAVMRKASVALNFKILGGLIGTSGVRYALEVYLPRIKFLEGGVEIQSQAMMTGGAFQATKDPTAGYECQISLTNSFDNSSLGGLAVTPIVTAGAAIANNTVTNMQVNDSSHVLVGDTINIAGATSNPYTVSSLPDATHITVSTLIQCLNGPVQPGSAVTVTNRQFGPGGLGGWSAS